jgi:dextranase
MSNETYGFLPSAVIRGEDVVVDGLPQGTIAIRARSAFGRTFSGTVEGDRAILSDLPVGTHAIEALSGDGEVLGDDFVGVRTTLGDDPVMGFATSFNSSSTPAVLSWLRQLRCTVVQIYDWMERYSSPLAERDSYLDPLNRPIELKALRHLIEGIRENGAVAQAYAPVCAADEEFARDHESWLLRRNDGAPESLGNLLQIMDPANPEWQAHWIDVYGRALDALGFNGLHLDTYGYPRMATDAVGAAVSIDEGYDSFVRAVRAARPRDVISFNQVNGVPRGFAAPKPPGFRYAEVWPPNDRWRHFEGLLERSAGAAPVPGDTLAIYPPVWDAERAVALRTTVLSEAIVTVLGAGVLMWGDDFGVLCHPYYVEHERLHDDEVEVVLQWHRFALRVRDLFRDGVDTSWYELDDENASVSVTWTGSTSPEPIGGSVFARVRRRDVTVVVSVVDLTGATEGSWRHPSNAGNCREVVVTVLVDRPAKWRAHVAVLGMNNGRFAAIDSHEVAHREGRALSCSVPIVDGWSVVRFETGES